MGLGKKTVEELDVKGKRVLVRCDFNVPMKDGKITNDNHIVAALPTIKKLIENGGKGILCSATLTLLLDWRIALVCWSLFAVLWLTTRYVSLGSVSAAAVFPVMTHLVFGDAFATAFSVLIATLVLFAHRENIKRLLNGTENKFRFHVNAPKSEGEV